MLIEFTVNNYLSIKDSITLSLVASNPVKELEDESTGLKNIFFDGKNKNKYLKSAVIYGANGSGKSNILSAISFVRRFILSSSNDSQADDDIKTIPFLLSSGTENAPSFFEIVFVLESIRYRYGFEADKKKVTAEWLFALDTDIAVKESTCFIREFQEIKINSKNFKEGKGIESKTRANALFLSTSAQLNGEIATKIQNWFRNTLNVISGLTDGTTGYTIQKIQTELNFKKRIVDFIKLINLGIEDIQIEEKSLNTLLSTIEPKSPKNEKLISLLEELKKEVRERIESMGGKGGEEKEITINSYHKKFDEANKLIETIALDFSLESAGTKKLFSLLGPWFETLENGEILIVDELDARLHSKLTVELLKIFHSKINTKNAQLIFASHDTNLLRSDLFRRDQIWFTEKNDIGATDLYSLVEYKINQATSVRNDASLEKDYLLGKYGAIPYFGNIDKFLNEFVNEPQQ